MFKYNNVWFGVLLGLVLPGIAFFFVEILKQRITFLRKADLLYIGCVALNLFLVRYLFNNHKENTARGVVASTFVCAFIFFYYKTNQ